MDGLTEKPATRLKSVSKWLAWARGTAKRASTAFCTAQLSSPVTEKSLFWRCHSVGQHGLESGRVLQECQVHAARRAITLFGDDKLRFSLQVGIVLLVNLFAENESHDVGVLLDGSGLP